VGGFPESYRQRQRTSRRKRAEPVTAHAGERERDGIGIGAVLEAQDLCLHLCGAAAGRRRGMKEAAMRALPVEGAANRVPE
jgi:hypothetical protein